MHAVCILIHNYRFGFNRKAWAIAHLTFRTIQTIIKSNSSNQLSILTSVCHAFFTLVTGLKNWPMF